MAEGTIQELRGTYGFIKPVKGHDQVFFHKSVLRDVHFQDLREGMRVEYQEIEGDRGPKATLVRLASGGQDETYRFLNPYNFIRYLDAPEIDKDSPADQQLLWRCPPPPHDRYVGLSGRITCEIEAVTPLFISDSHAIRKGENDHYSYRFFEYEGKPALPASSLRGMVRSVFEAVTNSCFGVFDGKRLSYRLEARKATTLVPGRIEKRDGQWVLRLLPGLVPLSPGRRPKGLYAATVHVYDPIQGKSTNIPKVELQDFSHGDRCYALVDKRGIFTYVIAVAHTRHEIPDPKHPSQQIVEGWLCINNKNVENKRKERLFFRAPENATGPTYIPLPSEVHNAYEDLIQDYQERHADTVKARRGREQPLDEVIGKGQDATPALSRYMYRETDLKVKEGTLVYASLSDLPRGLQVDFIAPAAVPRVAYDHSIANLLPAYLHTCDEYNELCPACRTFGWVHPAPPEERPGTLTAYAGRVHFSHATLQTDKGALDDITLAVLSSPKPTTTRFYLRPRVGEPRAGRDDDAVGYDGDNVLRGRKYYRHHGDTDPREYQRTTIPGWDGKDDQNRTIRGARRPGTTFQLTVRFTNLMPVELGALLWALELEDENWKGIHRLGYAKPLGFGSVKIGITQLEIFKLPDRYETLEETDRQEALEQKSTWIEHFREVMGWLYDQDFTTLSNVRDLKALAGKPSEFPIHYPRVSSEPTVEGKNFEWFMGNKRSGRDAGPRLVLPLADEDTDGLPLLDKYGRQIPK